MNTVVLKSAFYPPTSDSSFLHQPLSRSDLTDKSNPPKATQPNNQTFLPFIMSNLINKVKDAVTGDKHGQHGHHSTSSLA